MSVFDKSSGVWCPNHECDESCLGPCLRASCVCSTPCPKSAFTLRQTRCPIIFELVSDQFYSFVLLLILLFRWCLDFIFYTPATKLLFGQNALAAWSARVCPDPSNAFRFILQACDGPSFGSTSIYFLNPLPGIDMSLLPVFCTSACSCLTFTCYFSSHLCDVAHVRGEHVVGTFEFPPTRSAHLL